MLFNSLEFIALFLPATLMGFLLLGRYSGRAQLYWITLASLVFFGWGDPTGCLLIGISILFNFAIATVLLRSDYKRRTILTAGVITNLALLGYYKYTNLFIGTLTGALGLEWTFLDIALPLAISFYTFQQIAYLVDAYRRQVDAPDLLRYAAFVLFFPQLIAGPIVHHGEMMGQFRGMRKASRLSHDVIVGLTIFALGLFKKVAFADGCASLADPVFAAAEGGGSLGVFECWGGALSFTFQIYFDFSGYSDMAVGLARLFGVRLPENFNSPYKATNIVEFWRRWHITLSRFLRDYLYIPLGGNRKGPLLRYRNLMLTMLLGGLWHGASWTFLAWGGMHGLYLVINHGWHRATQSIHLPPVPRRIARYASRLLTFLAVVLAWVVFRAQTWAGAQAMFEGMFGANGIALPPALLERLPWFGDAFIASPAWVGVFGREWGGWGLGWLLLLWGFCLMAPNTQEYMRQSAPLLGGHEHVAQAPHSWGWQGLPAHGIVAGLIGGLALLILLAAKPTSFIYFRF